MDQAPAPQDPGRDETSPIPAGPAREPDGSPAAASGIPAPPAPAPAADVPPASAPPASAPPAPGPAADVPLSFSTPDWLDDDEWAAMVAVR
ncbi:MAG: hypothetical protein ACRDOL_41810, partial [Streptosporangiaceae bacterium]